MYPENENRNRAEKKNYNDRKILMSANKNIIKMICRFSGYDTWDRAFDENVCAFFKTYSVYPNIALASVGTWEKVDECALDSRGDICMDIDDPGSFDDEETMLSFFRTPDYTVEFCRDETLAEDCYLLVFDEDPIFDGEPAEDGIAGDVYRKIA
jgi:hypothetical protein